MQTMMFETYLNKFDEAAWQATVASLLPSIHKVDQNAVQIWFRFYPLALHRYLAAAEDKEKALREFNIQGNYALKDQIDTSHHFLYGHRYWKAVKAAIRAEAEVFENEGVELAEEIRQLAAMIAEKVKADTSHLLGITAVGLMTLVQSGLEAFSETPGDVGKPSGVMAKSPDAIVASRKKDDSQGMLGFLKTINKQFSIHHQETSGSGSFKIMNDQELTSASTADRSQDWQARDPRCWGGVIPIECTAASCGTCWIGILGGEEKLSPVARRERRAMKVFGYGQPEGDTPFLRLACQSKASGNATIVIPPWNGVFGKDVYDNIEHVELEPVTTSAKHLRETVKEATGGE
jgi:ferredoxin